MKPTEYLYSQSGTFDNGSIAVTDFISNLQYADLLEKKMGEPYCIGYVKYEDFPKCIEFHKIIWDSNHIEFKTNPQNIGWGYCLQAGVGTQFPGGRQMYALNNEERIITWFTGNDERTRFINDVKMATLNTRFSTTYGSGVFPFRLDCVSLILNNEIASDNFVADIQFFTNETGRFSENSSINTTFADFENFIKNNGTLTFTMSPFGTFNLKLSDFNEFNIATVQNTDQTFTLYLAIRNLYTSAMSVHGYEGTYYSRMVTPFFCYKFGELATSFLPDISTVYIPGISLNIPYISFRVMQSGSNYAIDPVNLYLYSENMQGCQTGERPFSVTTEDLQNANVQHRTVGIVAGKFFIGNGGGEQANHVHYLYTQNNPAEIYKYLLFYHKAFAGNTVPSANDRWETYYPEWTTSIFDENDAPTGERITGSYTDAAFMEKLRPWQMPDTSITTNEFDADDIPEYEPPEPSGDEDPFGGSNWMTNSFPYGGTDGFVTQYVLTESQLQSFGANLWAKFFTKDFWESICVILPESLSINASDILNYVVSLREYPFDVTAVGNCASDDPIIFIGRGIVGVTVTGNAIHRMLEYNGHISIESNPIKPYFGDFRDYEPCTRITLFVPFCGVVELTPSQVIGGTITLRYSIDFSTGAIQCTVQVNRGAFTTNLNTLSGTVGANVQMSASNLTQVLQKGAGMVANFSKSTALFAIGMGEVGAAEGAIASAESEQEIANAVGKYQHGASTAQSAFSVPDLNGVPVPVFGQSGGFASFQITEPMIQRTYHYYELPSNYAHVYGYACNKTVTLSTLEGKGFTVCKNVDLSGIPATQDELTAIESLLTSGVYF